MNSNNIFLLKQKLENGQNPNKKNVFGRTLLSYYDNYIII